MAFPKTEPMTILGKAGNLSGGSMLWVLGGVWVDGVKALGVRDLGF